MTLRRMSALSIISVFSHADDTRVCCSWDMSSGGGVLPVAWHDLLFIILIVVTVYNVAFTRSEKTHVEDRKER